MSSKTTVIWLLVAVVLGAAAVLLLRSTGGTRGSAADAPSLGERMLTIDPGAVQAITIAHADGSSEMLERATAGPAEWIMRVRPAGAPASSATTPWPVPASRVQALVRLLNDVQVRAAAAGDAALGDRPVNLSIQTADGGATSVRLGDQSVAGKALMEIESTAPQSTPPGTTTPAAKRRAMVDDALHLLFRDHAAREWRDRTALYGADLSVSRVNLENNKGVSLALGKVDGAWNVREPLAAPADPAAIQRLLSTVTGVQIVDFLDQGVAAATTQLDQPAARVTLETDRRELAAAADQPGTIVVESRELEIGGAADAAGTRLFARVDNERTVVIDARSVAELKLEPALFIWPFPTRLNPGDIGTIAIERSAPNAAVPGSVYRRELERWKQIRADGQEVLLPDSDIRPVVALLGFLCGPGASSAAASTTAPMLPTSIAGTAPESLAPLGRITLLSLSGAPLESLEVGSAKPGTITIRTAGVFRTFSLDRAPSLIADFLQVLPPPSNARDATGVPEDGK